MSQKGINNETIAAIATPLGQGGVGIIRLSGHLAWPIVHPLFRSARSDFQNPKPYTLHHGWIYNDQNSLLDEVLISYMPQPGSYTGQDVVEINCHGGPIIVQKILEEVLKAGARMARPGEFTLRAFWNGRMDLTQAEAIAEMISAQNQSGLQMAETKLQGALGEVIVFCKDKLTALRTRLCLLSDFPEEDEEELSKEDFNSGLQDIKSSIESMLDNLKRYNLWREGALVVLAGQVNVGKSSILNAVLGKKRAIVTSQPGTTRDYLEEMVNLEGLMIRLVDTAGMRQTLDHIELEGLEQGQKLVDLADLVCLVFDLSVGLDKEAIEIASDIKKEKLLLVGNKIDISADDHNLVHWLEKKGVQSIFISAKTGQGMEELLQAIRSRLIGSSYEPGEDLIVPNLRQSKCLRAAWEELSEVEKDLSSGIPLDLLDLRLEACSRHLSEVTGEITSEEVLDQIFSNFCIGK